MGQEAAVGRGLVGRVAKGCKGEGKAQTRMSGPLMPSNVKSNMMERLPGKQLEPYGG
jgi:hypothetical protein